MRYGVVFALVAALVVLPACAKKSTTTQGSTTIQGANGPVTITQDQGSKSVTFQSKEGTSKLGADSVLGQSVEEEGPPRMRVGTLSRIGSTTWVD